MCFYFLSPCVSKNLAFYFSACLPSCFAFWVLYITAWPFDIYIRIYSLRPYSDQPLLSSLTTSTSSWLNQFLAPHSSQPATALAHLASEDGEGQSAGLAQLSGAPWAGGGVGGVPSTGGEAEGPRPCSEPRLLSPHRARAHHLVQQPTAWRPHGRCPRLRKHTETHTHHKLPFKFYFVKMSSASFCTNNQFEYVFRILWFKLLKSSEHVLISLLLYDSKLNIWNWKRDIGGNYLSRFSCILQSQQIIDNQAIKNSQPPGSPI